jgi:hypothetical protein
MRASKGVDRALSISPHIDREVPPPSRLGPLRPLHLGTWIEAHHQNPDSRFVAADAFAGTLLNNSRASELKPAARGRLSNVHSPYVHSARSRIRLATKLPSDRR